MVNYHLQRLIASAVIGTLLLVSCSQKKDGPPNFYVDENKVHDAVPKPEQLSKYGNMPSYVVFGKRYYTLKSSRNYEETGTASWYGTQFHEHKTSSGELYNLAAMTAAHKTLPLPTYVEVTNLKNGRKIVVKVNDRGPFASDRIIDLSYVAAKKLGMLQHGTAPVRIHAIDPYTYGSNLEFARNTTPTPVHQFQNKPVHSQEYLYLQAGAFKSRENAEKLRSEVAQLIETPVRVANPNFKNNLYLVKIGPIRDIVDANKITNQLRQIGITPRRVM